MKSMPLREDLLCTINMLSTSSAQIKTKISVLRLLTKEFSADHYCGVRFRPLNVKNMPHRGDPIIMIIGAYIESNIGFVALKLRACFGSLSYCNIRPIVHCYESYFSA